MTEFLPSPTDAPDLSIVKPRQKKCLTNEECGLFENCISESYMPNISLMKVEGVPKSYVIDGVLTLDECAALRQQVDSHPELSFWCQGKEADAETMSFRNVKTIEVYSHNLAQLLWRRIENEVGETLNENIFDESADDYEREIEGLWVPSGLNPDSLFARYPSHGSFAPHTDGRAIVDFNNRSHYSVIVYLNDVPLAQGGGTRFYKREAISHLKKGVTGDNEVWTADDDLKVGEVEAVAGRMLIFYQHLVHEGVPPLAPFCKYIIRSDVISSRTPAICDSPTDKEAYRLFKEGENLVENGSVEEGVKLFKKAFKMSPLMAQIMGQA